MMSKIVLALSLSSAAALNIVANGPTLKRGKATGASTVAMPADKLAQVFKQFDLDGNGYLDESEIKAAFQAAGHPVTSHTVHHSFTILDKNHDGKVSLAEFKELAYQTAMPSLAEISARDMNREIIENVGADDEYTTSVRDQRLAKNNPKAYCIDRCLSTGYCEVLEDFMEMTTNQVKAFCESCAGEDECELSYA